MYLCNYNRWHIYNVISLKIFFLISQNFVIIPVFQTAYQKQPYIYCQRRFLWNSPPEIIVSINFGSEICLILCNTLSCVQSSDDKVLSAILSWRFR